MKDHVGIMIVSDSGYIIIRTVDFSDTVVYSRSILTAVDVSKKHFIVLQYTEYSISVMTVDFSDNLI